MPTSHEVERFRATLSRLNCNSKAIRLRNAAPDMQQMNVPEDGVFDQAVAVFGYRTGDVRNIGSAREAAEWLLHELPHGRTDSRARAARHACTVALEGGDVEIARAAFRLAVKEAGSLIGDVDRVYKPAKPERSKVKAPPAEARGA